MSPLRHSPEHYALLVQNPDSLEYGWHQLRKLSQVPICQIVAIGLFAAEVQGHTHLVDMWCLAACHHTLRQDWAVDSSRKLTADELYAEAERIAQSA